MPLVLPRYQFKNSDLLDTALTHRSVGRDNNERLEFLGDSILGFVIAEILFTRYPDQPEGNLTRLRAKFVKRETLSSLARDLDIGSYLILGPGEKRDGGWERDSILANALESIIGAIYLDSGISACIEFINTIYSDLFKELNTDDIHKDSKTILQEILQSRKIPLPDYRVIDEVGEPHKRIFTVSCTVESLGHYITARGKSKRIAEQSAASIILALIDPSR